MTSDALRALALLNPVNAAILARLPALGLDQAFLVAGCLYQAVWNHREGKPVGWGIRIRARHQPATHRGRLVTTAPSGQSRRISAPPTAGPDPACAVPRPPPLAPFTA